MNIELGDQRPIIVAIAGPNGAGKSTFHEEFIRSFGLPFINADEIALELRMDAYAAAENAARLRAEFVTRSESFVFETVLSDPAGEKIEFLRQAATTHGYAVLLCFIGIDSAETSNERVFTRVSQGGHDVPSDKLIARYPRTMANLARAIQNLPRVYVYDNRDSENPYRFVAEYEVGQLKKRGEGWPDWFKMLVESR